MQKKKRKFKVCCVPMNSISDINSNINSLIKKINLASTKGADFILLPENATYIGSNKKLIIENSFEEKKHPGVLAITQIAVLLKKWVLVGSVYIKEKRKIFNRSILIGPDGKIKKRYDKIHLFKANLPDGKRYNENDYFTAGKKISLFDLPWGSLGMTICYDLRFPNLYRKLAQSGALFISVPSAFTKYTGNLHWHTLLKARAIETGCYIFAPAQYGKHYKNHTTFGHSLIVDPWGKVISDSKKSNKLFIVEIDSEIVEEARQSIPTLKNSKIA